MGGLRGDGGFSCDVARAMQVKREETLATETTNQIRAKKGQTRWF